MPPSDSSSNSAMVTTGRGFRSAACVCVYSDRITRPDRAFPSAGDLRYFVLQRAGVSPMLGECTKFG